MPAFRIDPRNIVIVRSMVLLFIHNTHGAMIVTNVHNEILFASFMTEILGDIYPNLATLQ